jgi:hypothetical protein
MVRSEKAPDGTKGVYTIISGDARSTAAIVVDAQGRIATGEPLSRIAGGQARFAPPAPPAGTAAPAGGGRAGGGGGRGGPGRGGAEPSSFVSMFAPAADPAYRSNDWNYVEIVADADVFRTNVNGRAAGVAIDGTTGTFGPVALHVAGSGEVRFKDIAI